jgi:serine/threonine protein kinase
MTIIGHGTYGCIYKPPIKCAATSKTRKNPINYTNKIAKLLTEKSANAEYKEYNIVSKIDPKNKYHLGKPILCHADAADLKQKTDAHPCKKYNEEKDNEEFRLLIMEYGGIELRKYIETPKTFTSDFWKKARNIFEGAQLFAKNGITHRDIKTANILLNPGSKQLIYIDFGLSRNVKELTKDIISGKKKTSFHWSYPFEYGLVSQAKKIMKMNDAEIDELYRKTVNLVFNETTADEYKSIKTMLTLLDDRMFPLNQLKVEVMIHESIDSIRMFNSVEECVETMVKTIDMFSLGLTMNETLNAFYDAGKITHDFYRQMRVLLANMTSFNMQTRLQDYGEALTLYDNIIGTSKNKKKSVKTKKK